MTAPAPTAAAPATETNLDLAGVELGAIQASLARIDEQTDALARERDTLAAQVAAASERVAATGGTTATITALDGANAVVEQLGAHLGGFSEAAAEAADVTSAARAGLAPALDAQDSLHAAGARGEFVSSATD